MSSPAFKIPIADKGGQVFNVNAYGAVGDGVTDDLAAINVAIAAANAAGGGKVVGNPSLDYCCAPSGTTLYLIAKSNVCLSGLSLKLKANAGNYECLIASASLGTAAVDKFTLEDVTIDQNAAANTTGTVAVSDGARQYAVMLFNATGFRMRNCWVTYCGINGVAVNGPNCDDVEIGGNDFDFVPKSPPAAYDNSGVYLNATNHRVTKNYFYAAAGSGARSAIETHGGPSTVTGNNTSGFAGVNVVTQSSGSTAIDSNNINVSDNVLTNCDYGVRIWLITGQSLKNLTVNDNTISINQADRAADGFAGIQTVLAGDATLDGTLDGFTIQGNTIQLQAEERTMVASAATTGGIIIDTVGAVSNGTIANNVIRNSPTQGIVLRGTTGTIGGVKVDKNEVVDAGNNSLATAGYRAYFGLYTNLKDCELTDNTLRDTGATVNGLNGIVNTITTNGRILNLLDRGNKIFQTAASGSLARGYSATACAEVFTSFTVAGNVSLDAMRYERWDLTMGASSPAFTISHFGSHANKQYIKLDLINTSGGAGPAITWTNFKLQGGAYVNAATGSHKVSIFRFDGTNYVEEQRSADIPN